MKATRLLLKSTKLLNMVNVLHWKESKSKIFSMINMSSSKLPVASAMTPSNMIFTKTKIVQKSFKIIQEYLYPMENASNSR